MASKRISELSSGGTADGTMLWVPATDVTANYKFTLQDLHNGGWIFDPQPWVYVSATSFKISGLDVAYRFSKGTRIRLTQTTTKYFVVTGATYSGGDTTVTITGGSDYTLANAAITLGQYSYEANPEGYPGWFNYTPIWTSSGTAPAIGNGVATGRFRAIGPEVLAMANIVFGSTSTYGTGIYRLSTPIDANPNQAHVGSLNAYIQDNSAGLDQFVPCLVGAATYMIARTEGNATTDPTYIGLNTPYVWATSDILGMSTIYEMA